MDTDDERRPARLRRLKLGELSLVDRGANPHARVALFKRGEEPMAFNSFEDAVAELAKRTSRTEAMTKARALYPRLFDAYQQEGAELGKRKPVPPLAKEPVNEFYDLVRDIRLSRRVSRTKALELARRENPAAFAASQKA